MGRWKGFRRNKICMMRDKLDVPGQSRMKKRYVQHEGGCIPCQILEGLPAIEIYIILNQFPQYFSGKARQIFCGQIIHSSPDGSRVRLSSPHGSTPRPHLPSHHGYRTDELQKFKLIMLGNIDVGKTSLLIRLMVRHLPRHYVCPTHS